MEPLEPGASEKVGATPHRSTRPKGTPPPPASCLLQVSQNNPLDNELCLRESLTIVTWSVTLSVLRRRVRCTTYLCHRLPCSFFSLYGGTTFVLTPNATTTTQYPATKNAKLLSSQA